MRFLHMSGKASDAVRSGLNAGCGVGTGVTLLRKRRRRLPWDESANFPGR